MTTKTDQVEHLIQTAHTRASAFTNPELWAREVVDAGLVDGSVGTVKVLAQRVVAKLSPRSVVVASDFHFPYEHKALVRNWLRFVEDAQPDVVVLNGDVLDFESISRYAKKPGGPSLQAEIDAGEEFLSQVADAAPNAERHFTLGNHEHRLERWLMENAGVYDLRCLAISELLSLDDYGFQLHGYEVPVDFGQLSVVHGKYTQMYAAKATLHKEGYDSVVHGHVHRFQAWYETGHRGTRRAYSLGCMCNPDAMDYFAGPKNWQLGFGSFVVYDDGDVHGQMIEARPDGSFVANGRYYR